MSDFKFIEDQISKHWVVSAPRRSKRPNISKGTQAPVCPFCPGNEDSEVYRIPSKGVARTGGPHRVPASEQSELRTSDEGGERQDPELNNNWDVRVVANKYPFAPIHEVIVHSQDHHKSFDELPQTQVEKILEVFKARYNTHKDSGQVYIFTNSGEPSGESMPHPHSQLVVVPNNVKLDIPKIPEERGDELTVHYFKIFCPPTSSWPDEVWVVPDRRGVFFGDIFEEEKMDLAFILSRIIKIMDIRHGQEFPYNLYIYPGKDWYLRLIPRIKILGGFEVGTGVIVNTQDPKNTFRFISSNFQNPDEQLIRREHMAEYGKAV